MTSFLGLPFEIRTIIYDLSLITDEVIFPYVTYYEADDGIKPYSGSGMKLAIGLLGVNKMVRTEAAAVLFGRNTWHLSKTWEAGDGDRDDEPLWEAHIHRFRHMKVRFDTRDVHPQSRRNYEQSWMPTNEHRVLYVHHAQSVDLSSSWYEKRSVLLRMQLESIWINISNCSCPSSCCRLTQHLLFHPYMLNPWHRDPSETDHLTSQVPWLPDEGRDWSEPEKPLGLCNMQIRFQGAGDTHEHCMLHKLGLGCDICPEKDGIIDSENCYWKKFIDENRVTLIQGE